MSELFDFPNISDISKLSDDPNNLLPIIGVIAPSNECNEKEHTLNGICGTPVQSMDNSRSTSINDDNIGVDTDLDEDLNVDFTNVNVIKQGNKYPLSFRKNELKKEMMQIEQVIDEYTAESPTMEFTNISLKTIPLLILNNTDKYIEMTNLSFQNNNITTINTKLFSYINLTTLNFSKNKILSVPEEIISLVNLTHINLSQNHLVDLPYNMSNLKQMKTIYLTSNDFRQIPPVVLKMHNITCDISMNPNIISFPPFDLMGNINITIDNHPKLKTDLENKFCQHITNTNIGTNIGTDTDTDTNTDTNINTNNTDNELPCDLHQELSVENNNNNNNYKEWIHTEKNIKIIWNNCYPDNIINNLYLGSLQCVSNEYVYECLNIDTIFTVMNEHRTIYKKENMTHVTHNISDIVGCGIDVKKINNIVDELHEILKYNDGCIVHCFLGVSRSSTIIIAYIMKYQNMCFLDAYTYVLKKRPIINPNDGFIELLKVYEKFLITQTVQSLKSN